MISKIQKMAKVPSQVVACMNI